MDGTCEGCDAMAIGGGNSTLLLKCGHHYIPWKESCSWQCPFCAWPAKEGGAACHTHESEMACVGNAIRRALTPSRVAKAILFAQRTGACVDSQAWERAFGPDYASRILWFSHSDGLFRVAEDGTAADVDDNLLPLPPQPWYIGVQLHTSPEEWERWRRVFYDYGITSPVGQWT